WKVAQGKLLKSSDLSSWVEAYPASEGIVFTVVSGNGPDIWAGGSKAVLVHSRDAGTTWDKVRLGVAASGDIMAIEGGGLTLQVKTSTGQTWVTSDGGSSWNQR
ncbi:MAG TPA: YCF48-related protein, partial [Candidatus Angelobacter sp.]|nr:YCF48-related protein [Candidatus Angelobacter sp.]